MKKLPFSLLIAFLLLLPHCKKLERTTPIEDLLRHPERYNNPHSARVEGVVLSTFNFLGITGCTISDTSGKIKVVSAQTYAQGQRIRLSGHVEPIIGLNSLRILVFIPDSQ